MVSRSVTVESIDALYLLWNDHINASALYRQALREKMALRDGNPNELRNLLNQAHEKGYNFEEITAETNRYTDLKQFVK